MCDPTSHARRTHVARTSQACRTHIAIISQAHPTCSKLKILTQTCAKCAIAHRTHIARILHAHRTHIARTSHAHRTYIAHTSHVFKIENFAPNMCKMCDRTVVNRAFSCSKFHKFVDLVQSWFVGLEFSYYL